MTATGPAVAHVPARSAADTIYALKTGLKGESRGLGYGSARPLVETRPDISESAALDTGEVVQ